MLDSRRLLVVTHPVLAAIPCTEIDKALANSPSLGCEFVEIAPLRTTLDEQYDIDWAVVHRAQEQQFIEKLRPHLEGREQLAYFGFAPIPLAIHLGYRIQSGIRGDVYQRHHQRGDWLWSRKNKNSTRSFLTPIRLPQQGSLEAGAVVIRVSTSYCIASADTEQVVSEYLAAVDIALVSPGLDALETREALESVVEAFSAVLARLRDLFPNMTKVHLFAAVPVGLAFRLGTCVNPTIYPDVVTYQYMNCRLPRYREAIVLGANPIPEAKALPRKRPHWHGNEIVTGHQATFLDISFLHEGLRVAQSVVLLRAHSQMGKELCGTGFLIAPDTILTNHHVLYDHDDHDRRVQRVTIRFHYEYERPGQLRKVEDYEGDTEGIVGDKNHDWAVIRSKTPIPSAYPFLNIQPRKPVELRDYVYIIQHPGGRPKKLGMLHNDVVHVDRDRVQYRTDTLPGSSGSPVCNEYWEVVALHYIGIKDPSGGQNHHKNEGIRIDRVVEGLKAHKIIE